MGAGKLVINIEDAMQASSLEDLLFEIKSGEHVIDKIGWVSKDRLKPTTMTITFNEGKKKPKQTSLRTKKST